MRQCMSDLRDGWYGNAAYRQWVKDGQPLTADGKQGGQVLSEPRRAAEAKHRFGKSKGAADWIPRTCVRPVNCQGLVDRAKKEAEEMIPGIPGLSGTLADLVIDPGFTMVEKAVVDMSDLTGLPAEAKAGNVVSIASDMVSNEDGSPAVDNSVGDDPPAPEDAAAAPAAAASLDAPDADAEELVHCMFCSRLIEHAAMGDCICEACAY